MNVKKAVSGGGPDIICDDTSLFVTRVWCLGNALHYRRAGAARRHGVQETSRRAHIAYRGLFDVPRQEGKHRGTLSNLVFSKMRRIVLPITIHVRWLLNTRTCGAIMQGLPLYF